MATREMLWALFLVLHLASAATPMPEYLRRTSPSVSPRHRQSDERLSSASGSDYHAWNNHKGPFLQKNGSGQRQETGTKGRGQQPNVTNSFENYEGHEKEIEVYGKETLSAIVVNQSISDEVKENADKVTGQYTLDSRRTTKENADKVTGQYTLDSIQQDPFMRAAILIASNDANGTKVNQSHGKGNTHAASNFVDIDIGGRWQKILSLFSKVFMFLISNVKQNEVNNILSVNRLKALKSYSPKLESKILTFLQKNIVLESFKLYTAINNTFSVTNISSSSNYQKENIDAGIAQLLIAGARKLVEQYISGHFIGSTGSVLKMVANIVFVLVSDTGSSSNTSRANSSRSIHFDEWIDSFENNRDSRDQSNQSWQGYWTDIEDDEQRTHDAFKYDSAGPASSQGRYSLDSDSLVFLSDAPKLDPGEFMHSDDAVVYVSDEPQFNIRGITHDNDEVKYVGGHPTHRHYGHAYFDDDGMRVIGHSKTHHGHYTDDNDEVMHLGGHSQSGYREFVDDYEKVLYESGQSPPDYLKFIERDGEVVYLSGHSKHSRNNPGHDNDAGEYSREHFKPDLRHERNNDDVVYSNKRFERRHPDYMKKHDDIMYVRGRNEYPRNDDIMNVTGHSGRGRNEYPHNDDIMYVTGHSGRGRNEYPHNNDVVKKLSGHSKYYPSELISNKMNSMYIDTVPKQGRGASGGGPNNVAYVPSMGIKELQNSEDDRHNRRNPATSGGQQRQNIYNKVPFIYDNYNSKLNSAGHSLEYNTRDSIAKEKFPNRAEYKSRSGPDRQKYGSSSGPDGLEYGKSSWPDRLEYGNRSRPDTLEYGRLEYGGSIAPDRYRTATYDAKPQHSLKGFEYYGVYELIAFGGAWLLLSYVIYKFLAIAAPKTTGRWLSRSRGLRNPGVTWEEANSFQSILSQIASAKEKYRALQQGNN